MKITSLKLNDFKFYIEQSFNTNNKNILLYGENGSGKSSLYWALYYFYKCVYGTNSTRYIQQLDKSKSNNLTNHNTNQDAKITVTFDNNANIVIDKNLIQSNLTLNPTSLKTIHFLNHEKLFKLFLNSNINEFNFYDMIQKEFFNKFELFHDLEMELQKIEQSLQATQDTLLLNEKLVTVLTQLQELVNNRLSSTFKEQLEIKFIIDDKFIAESNNENIWFLTKPKIFVTINNHKDFNLRINEARVKLVSLLIYLVLVEKNNESVQASSNLLKLLVMDDILLSLDMAQRSKILEYIFEKFSTEYQLFIFTHDIFFYDLIKRKVMHLEDKTNFNQTTWEDIFVFSRENLNYNFEPIIYKPNDSYLNNARTYLQNNNLPECGNNLRKEMEKILQEMLIKFEIGKRGELYNLIEVFTKLRNKNLYKNSHKTLDATLDILNNPAINDNDKITQIKQLIESHISVNLTRVNKLLKDFQWHRQIVGNASSHAQLLQNYQNEFQTAITDVETIKSMLV